MNQIKYSEYGKEKYFPISITVMTKKNNAGDKSDKSRTPMHSHDFSEIVMIANGTILHHCCGMVNQLKKGDFFLIHPGTEHFYSDITDETKCYNILYNSNIPIPMLMLNSSAFLHHVYPKDGMKPNIFSGMLGNVALYDLSRITVLLDNMRREMRQRNHGHQTLIVSLFIAMVILLSRYCREEMHPDENWSLTKVIGMMKASCHENTISIPDYAKASGMCSRTLLRRFKAMFGIGPTEYLQRLRVGEAVVLLQNSLLTNEAIASQCGFYNSSHMWKVFQRHLKCSPTDLRSGKIKNIAALEPARLR